jgi:hypothetical protein
MSFLSRAGMFARVIAARRQNRAREAAMRRMRIRLAMMGVVISAALCVGQRPGTNPARRGVFLPQPLSDSWNRWLVGEWEGSGQSDTGSGVGLTRIELGLNGQFRIHHEEGIIKEMTPRQQAYLKRNMNATDEQIQRFRAEPYRAIELYTIDPQSGDVIGYLFDSLRCVATGRGTQTGDRETMQWEWTNGHRSTRVLQRSGEDQLEVIQRTTMPDGSVMEEKGIATRRPPTSRP